MLLLQSVVLLSLMVVATLCFDNPWAATAGHPDFQTMDAGGERAIDDAATPWLGTVFGVAMIIMLTTVLTLAADGMPNGKSLRRTVACLGVLYVGVYVMMMWAYQDYSGPSGHSISGPFATPTTWMMFGVGLTPALFAIMYALKFHQWFGSIPDPPEGLTNHNPDTVHEGGVN